MSVFLKGPSAPGEKLSASKVSTGSMLETCYRPQMCGTMTQASSNQVIT